MITLHVEAPTVKELMAKALVALGAMEMPAPTVSNPVPSPQVVDTVLVPATTAEAHIEAPKPKNKGGRKKQTDITSPSEAPAEEASAQPAVASNTGSDQAGTSPPADGAVNAAGADTQEISQPAADVTPEERTKAMNDAFKEIAALDGGDGIRHVSTMLHKVGGYRKTREVTDPIHQDRLIAAMKKMLANTDDFIANPDIYMNDLVP